MNKLIIAAAFILVPGVLFEQILQKGNILSVHQITITLQPDVTMEQFLGFFKSTWIPEVENTWMEAIVEKLQPVIDELSKLGSWTSTYTDWVIQ